MPIKRDLINQLTFPLSMSKILIKESKNIDVNNRLEVAALKELLPYFKALCEENRINIIRLLLEREHCVCELIDKLNLSQSTVSHHVKILKQAGLLNERRRGTWNYYSLNQNGFRQYAVILEEKLFQPVSKALFKECPSANTRC